MTPRRVLVACMASLLFASCSGATTEPAVGGATTSVDPAYVGPPASSVPDGAIEISVDVGIDSGPDRIEEVPLGSLVRIIVVNEDDADEVHLHGYDLGGYEVDAGEPTTFEFEASIAGEFEVESHVTGEVLMILVVR